MRVQCIPTYNLSWHTLIPPEHWKTYRSVLDLAKRQGLPFALGGGMATGVYTGKGRHTKDLDLYILPDHRRWAVKILEACGLEDLHETMPYDREWIFRGYKDDVIVDFIWAMANRRTQVDRVWLEQGPRLQMFDQQFRAIPPEELIWSKLYILQRDRCDWPDVLNLVNAVGPQIDWRHLFARLETDLPLMQGLLSVFCWVAPQRAVQLPRWIWKEVGLAVPDRAEEWTGGPHRSDLLDTRPWFTEIAVA